MTTYAIWLIYLRLTKNEVSFGEASFTLIIIVFEVC